MSVLSSEKVSSPNHNDNGFRISYVRCWDKTKTLEVTESDAAEEVSKISTGVGFLDHMLDQFSSHAQIGLSITVDHGIANSDLYDQELLMESIGACLGKELLKLMSDATKVSSNTTVFSCPLDEALVECTIGTSSSSSSSEAIFHYDVAPYGDFPKSTGRTRIGQMKTQPLQMLWVSLANSMNLSIFKLRKLRGHNGHHIVESSFKSFCRALRCYLDNNNGGGIWGTQSESFHQGVALKREGIINRCTKETSINVTLRLDGGKTGISINTHIPFLDEFYTALASECLSMSLLVDCQGDIWVDDHHTTEDVSIAIGQVIHKALGTKAGLNRMWTSEAQQGDAHVRVIMDLSNRPCLFHDLDLCSGGLEMLDSCTSVEMIPHVFESLVMNGHMTVHILQLSSSNSNIRDLILAAARAYGRALYHCIAVDPRRSGATASSKGTLST